MKTKICSCGDLIGYLSGERDWKGKQRENQPVPLRGSPRVAEHLLNALSPFLLKDKKRRCWFYSRKCAHLIAAFSEGRSVVDALAPKVIIDLERVVGAGLPEDSLYWVWFYHPQEVKGHPHGGVVKFVLPYGGNYDPELRTPESVEMFTYCDHLHNRKHGLSSQMDPDRARLLHPARGSYKDELAAHFEALESAVKAWWEKGVLTGNQEFFSLLPSVGLRPLAWTNREGYPRYFPAANDLGCEKVKTYRDSLAVLAPDGKQLVVRGPVIRPEFSVAFWNEEVKRRADLMEDLRQNPGKYVARFRELFDQRARRQRQRYPDAGALNRCISSADLDCVHQPPVKIIISPGVWGGMTGTPTT